MNFTVSLNLSYLCNFRCNFCYLTKEQLSDKKRSKLEDIKNRLEEISKYKQIEHIDLYGGEVGILSLKYLMSLDKLLRTYTDSINIITNLRLVNPYFLRNDITLSVSYDFEFRQDSEIVFNNISTLNKSVSILTLAIPEIQLKDPEELIEKLNTLPNIESWEVKKYSPNQSNDLDFSQEKYENFILKLNSLKHKMNFEFMNSTLIENSLNSNYIANSNSHIYITPDSKFGVLDFDKDSKEYFQELDSFEDYIKWSLKEQKDISNNVFCSQCKYYNRETKMAQCYTEHLRVPTKDPKKFSCDGAYKLLSNFPLEK